MKYFLYYKPSAGYALTLLVQLTVMRYLNLTSAIALFVLIGCGGSAAGPQQDSTLLNAHSTQKGQIDSAFTSDMTVLQVIFYNEYPRGGYFSGHPAIARNGELIAKVFYESPALRKTLKKNNGVIKGVRYTFFVNGDSTIVFKDVYVGDFDPK